MLESVKDRCARCYEHIFLFSKSKKYFFDYKAISEPIAPATAERLKRGMRGGNKYGKPVPGQPQPQSINRPREHGEIKDADINPLRNKRDVWKINTVPFKGGHYAAYPPKLVKTLSLIHISEPIAPATAERLKRGMKGGNKYGKPVPGQPQPQSINRPREHGEIKDADINPLRNKRDVWKINTVPFKGGHYAAYPPKLVETCLLAGCPEGGIVLDPFMGSGTTGMVASQMGRHFVGIELNPEYTELAYKRIGGEI